MEFRVFPAGFTLTPIKLPQQDGSLVDAMQLTVVDVSGTPFHIAFAGADWEMFQRAVSDPEGEAARAAARAKILPVNGRAPNIRMRKPPT